ncbi:MAG: threonine-phosphate decarboxylase CobD [Magnetococcus sp. XQGC-1]
MKEPLLREHGGAILRAAAEFNIPPENWLDLSTGINPTGWLPPPVPPATWAQLPQENDGLEEAALAYYQTPYTLPVAGSQAAIQALPYLRSNAQVAILSPTYNEHAHAWRAAGHTVTPITPLELEKNVPAFDVLIVVNPNNPTGSRVPIAQLLLSLEELQQKNGWLIVDEAFMDATPEESLAFRAGRPGLIVLRSLGKFFGLAGARVGFVLAEEPILRQLHARLGPWHLSGPSRWVAKKALQDTAWQEKNRKELPLASQRLAELLARCGYSPSGGTPLFQWVKTKEARYLWHTLAKKGILIRRFKEPISVRFGLPGDAAAWNRLETALADQSG